jgi:hypothetical protein
MTLRRTAVLAAVTVAVGAAVLAAPLSSASAEDRGGYSIGLWGDMPYGSDGVKALPATLASINRQELKFTVFDGDTKNGNSECSEAEYTQAKRNFSLVKWATIYTPGDNEWTDCDRSKKKGLPDWLAHDPNERLALIRSMFFSDSKSQGQDRLDVTQQSAQFPENARWEHDGVTFITVHVPGSDNNFPQFDANNNALDANGKVAVDTGLPPNGDEKEYTARNAANLAWLDAGFAFAKQQGSKGIMIIQQADMFGTDTQGDAGTTGDVTVHYADTVAKLTSLTSSFTGQVALVNGDDHSYLVDNPLGLGNFTRLITPGDRNHGWVRADIDAHSAKVFAFTEVTK